MPPNAFTIPGSHEPIDPTIVRKMRDDARIVFAIFLER